MTTTTRGLPLIERKRRLRLLSKATRRHRALAPVHCLLSRRNSSIASCASSRSHFFLSVHRLNQSLLPFLGSCHEDLVELMLDPRINPEAADQLFGPSDAGPYDAEAADRPFGPSNAEKTRPAQPPRGVPLPSIRIPVALPCLVFIVGVQSTKPFPASDCFKKGCFCWATGTKPTDPGLWPGEIDSHIRFEAAALVFCRHSFVHRRHGWRMSKARRWTRCLT